MNKRKQVNNSRNIILIHSAIHHRWINTNTWTFAVNDIYCINGYLEKYKVVRQYNITMRQYNITMAAWVVTPCSLTA